MGNYLYCVINGRVPKNKLQLRGLDGENIRLIYNRELSCAISNTDKSDCPLWREHILAHQKPIEEIMRYYDVLPFGFSNIADSEEQARQKVLKERNKELKELFKKFKGKIELGLRGAWSDMPAIFQEIAESSSELRRLKKASKISYQQQMVVGEIVKKMLQEKREKTKKKILESFQPLAEDFKELQILGDDMILNVAFLVKKEKETDFYQKAAEAVKEFPGVRLRYSGPFPLYNFINLRLHV